MILIVGTPDDAPSAFMHDRIVARGEKAVYFDTTRYPSDVSVGFDPCTGEGSLYEQSLGAIPLAEIRSVYRRWSRGVVAPQEADPVLQEAVYWNLESAVGSFFRCLDCLWVNSQEATEMHKYKGYQLKLLNAAGIRIPKTRITTQPEELIAFYHQLDKEVIYKPVRGWAHTEKLTDADLTPERLAALPHTPVKLQEFVPGTDIRAYVVNREIFAMEIHSDTLDFRADTDAPRVPVELPASVASDCLKVADTLDLVFTGIDLRRTPSGEYVFFEANPTPVFLYDEQVTGLPISNRLVSLLLRGSL